MYIIDILFPPLVVDTTSSSNLFFLFLVLLMLLNTTLSFKQMSYWHEIGDNFVGKSQTFNAKITQKGGEEKCNKFF